MNKLQKLIGVVSLFAMNACTKVYPDQNNNNGTPTPTPTKPVTIRYVNTFNQLSLTLSGSRSVPTMTFFTTNGVHQYNSDPQSRLKTVMPTFQVDQIDRDATYASTTHTKFSLNALDSVVFQTQNTGVIGDTAWIYYPNAASMFVNKPFSSTENPNIIGQMQSYYIPEMSLTRYK